jgi:mannose-6-phosphate isomerase
MALLRLTPSFREKVWGSTHLEPWFPDSDRKIGEVWFEGVDNLPLLVKFIFTSEKLSVQVHPDDAYAREHHASRGKTEMWHILAAAPGAKIAAGFHREITPQELKDSAQSGEIENLLEWVDARPGDTFFIPAGTVHAIGAGLVLCEIQQHSDITYRLYDYGRPRELHLDRAAAVSHLGPYNARASQVSCEYFCTSQLAIAGPTQHTPPPETLELLIALEGSGEISGQPIHAGEVSYVPPGTQPFALNGNIKFLNVTAGNIH